MSRFVWEVSKRGIKAEFPHRVDVVGGTVQIREKRQTRNVHLIQVLQAVDSALIWDDDLFQD